MMDKALEEFNRQAREKLEEALEQDVFAHFAEIFPDGKKDIAEVLYNMKKEKVRSMKATIFLISSCPNKIAPIISSSVSSFAPASTIKMASLVPLKLK